MLLYYQSCPWFPESFVVQICRPHWQMIQLWLATGLFVVFRLRSPPHMSSPAAFPHRNLQSLIFSQLLPNQMD